MESISHVDFLHFLKVLQKIDKFAIKRVVEAVRFLDGMVYVAFEVVGAFSADVDAENLVVRGEFCNDFFERFHVE